MIPNVKIVRDENNTIYLRINEMQQMFKTLSNNTLKLTTSDLIKAFPLIFGPLLKKKSCPLMLQGKTEITYEEFNDIISNIPTIYSTNIVADIFKDYFIGSDKSRVDIQRVAKLLKEVGLQIESEEDMKILSMVLDKDKDGVVSLKDIMSCIPTYKVRLSLIHI